MQLITALPEHIPELTRISKIAFESDIYVGSPESGGPPGYDSPDFHTEMLAGDHLYAAFHNDSMVGGAILFVDASSPWHMYIGRIFVDPMHFRKGLGIMLMHAIENLSDTVTTFALDTPEWNIRTNNFYGKLGYSETGRESGMIRYQKRK